MTSQRSLTFTNWESVEADLRLLLQGYESTGNWNLAQTALHLNDWMRFPMEGYPRNPFPIRVITRMIRNLAGKSLLEKILTQGFRDNTPTLPQTVYPASQSDETAAVETLLETIARFRNFSAPFHASPLFGDMDYSTAEQLQFIHFAHHLKRLHPVTEM